VSLVVVTAAGLVAHVVIALTAGDDTSPCGCCSSGDLAVATAAAWPAARWFAVTAPYGCWLQPTWLRRTCSPVGRIAIGVARSRKLAHNLPVRGDNEEGTTTTPFDMVMLNDVDRFHLVIDVIDRAPGLAARAAHLRQRMVDERLHHRAYTRDHGDDLPDACDSTSPGA
jgi:XFP C-terminal domain